MKEKRKASRIQVIDSFSVFLVIPELGPYKNKISDLSEIGIGFESENIHTDLEPEKELSVQLYLNQTLYLPLKLKIARTIKKEDLIIYGAEFMGGEKKSLEALKHFTNVLNCLEGIAEIGNS
jgi:hypothetical protein